MIHCESHNLVNPTATIPLKWDCVIKESLRTFYDNFLCSFNSNSKWELSLEERQHTRSAVRSEHREPELVHFPFCKVAYRTHVNRIQKRRQEAEVEKASFLVVLI